VEIPLAVSDISEVKDFDIRSRFPWQRWPLWKFQDLNAPLEMESTFLWSLVKIESSVSENLVGQVHGEKKKRNNNNNKKRCKNNKSPNFVWGLNNNEVWLCLDANTEVPKRPPYRNSGMWMQVSSIPTNSLLQDTPKYQFSLKSETINNLTILLAAILKMVGS
jgi:hypothetical protein